ncbi:uncharacterized protein [Aegilops tauschii subsp. strangulata]|uniref:uncharacterized protein n=1 Tax=Aegilops tauschii subsp. strangulata TaxID=200361 RepID=UPI003CC897CE
MSYTAVELVCWNVRGLNSPAKRDALRELADSMKVAIWCILETKLERVDQYVILQCLGPIYDGFVYLPASSTRGGIFVAWDSSRASITNTVNDTNFITGYVTPNEGAPWWLSVVYGPQEDSQKVAMLEELSARRQLCPGPWMAVGDFNMILHAADKNNSLLDRRMMGKFKRFVDDNALKELFLHGRRFTWSNEWERPTLTKIDRALGSVDWELAYPECLLQALSMNASDHCPLFLSLEEHVHPRKRFRFELFWTKLDGFLEAVQDGWRCDESISDPFVRLDVLLRSCAKHLTAWGQRRVGNIKLQIAIANLVILRLDCAQESRKAWTIVKRDVMAALNKLFLNNERGFGRLNQALITLIPKNPEACQIKDFRPICLVHSIPKMASKLLATRLCPRMGELVHANQSAFIKGRNIHDNFLLVRQLARKLYKRKTKSVMIKLDISRAFDSLSWSFLFEVLRAKGFSRTWRSWIATLLTTASSRVVVNGCAGKKFMHACGLRQGDSISPLLFVIAMDVLSAMILKAQETNTEALRLFGEASGLKVNFTKSSAIMIRSDEEEEELVRQAMPCKLETFPIKYLGLQLGIKQLTRSEWQPVVDQTLKLMPGWQRGLVTHPGRLLLVNQVMRARPIHHLIVAEAPKWALDRVDKGCRAFFWAGLEEIQGGQCAVAWRRVGIRQPSQVGSRGRFDGFVLEGSRGRFDGWINGSCVKEIAPLLVGKVRQQVVNRRKVKDALYLHAWTQDIVGEMNTEELSQFVRPWELLVDIEPTPGSEDTPIWQWDATGKYSAKSAYEMMCEGGVRFQCASAVWRSWAMMTCTECGIRTADRDMVCKIIAQHASYVTKRRTKWITYYCSVYMRDKCGLCASESWAWMKL